MKNEIKIIIADDHPLMRSGLFSVLKSEPNLKVVAEARDGEEAYNLLKGNKPDIATLDIEMPKMNGLEIARKISDEKLKVKIVFLTMYKDEDMFNQAMDVGAFGYVLKENAVNDIVDCINTVASGNYYISPMISQYLMRRAKRFEEQTNSSPSISDLTKTERMILRLISEEKTTKQISEDLFISYKTVENHRANISRKLNLHGSHSLVKFAITNKAIL
ncbi:MAG: response regulator transcription factor [Ignavibacteriaceae bacterium]